jgi:hypothetical protein
MKPKFKEGELVRHRASKQPGIIIGVIERCETHGVMAAVYAIGKPDRKCCANYQFSGEYSVSTGMTEVASIPEYVLEATEEPIMQSV